MRARALGRARRLAWIGLPAIALPAAAHALIVLSTQMAPPRIELPAPDATSGWTRVRAGLREVYLEGPPEAIGAAQARLLRDRMVGDEERLWHDYERYVPWWIARVGVEDLSRLRYRHLDRGIPEARRRELASESLAFRPDPFAGRIPTYQRMVFLHALYDIALSFEHSPLIGCTTFALGPDLTRDGHVLVGRAFDMETDDVLDRDKAVFLVRGEGAIPFASVAWPGFVGVVTGMNAQGVFMVVHGGRARDPSSEGVPVAFSLREALERAHDTGEAVRILVGQSVMVSHIVFVADGQGQFAVVERAPGVAAYTYAPDRSAMVTNDFQGPLASDDKNVRVKATTTSVARRLRGAQILARLRPHEATPRTALDVLRDHGCSDDPGCRLGDRRAIDAFIATHGVIGDTTARVLWVSVGPHLSGKFVRVDLAAMFAQGHDPSRDPEPDTMPSDPSAEERP